MTQTAENERRDLLKAALVKIAELEARLAKQGPAREPIAIVGIGCRMPGGADTPEAFWEQLEQGIDATSDVPAGRWDVDALFDPRPATPGKMYTRRGAFVDHVDAFDPGVFGISPREAASMDPQHRLLLEVSWHALEDSGRLGGLSGSRTGVFVGICGNDYSLVQLIGGDLEAVDTYFGAGIAHSIASGRLSYVLGLQGPSLSVDTACSSSLVAVHLACLSLRAGDCDMAIAGGVNVILTPVGTIAASQARMLAPDGRCKTFDASADGYVRAEGCAMVVLKPLAAARRDRDRILAVIRGTAANQDGRSNGLTAPNGRAQEAVIAQALADAGVRPADVEYVEAHGTGTSLGDPIEVHALGSVLAPGRQRPLLVGAVKSNIGHLEAAAGVAGLVKLVGALQRERIPRTLHVRQLNPNVAWSDIPVRPVLENTPWPRGSRPRLGGVSAFGFSGTNVHLVVEEPPAAPDDRPAEDEPQVLAIAAKSAPALGRLASRYVERLAATTDRFADICFTAGAGRAHLDRRLAVVARSAAEGAEKLVSRDGTSTRGVHAGVVPASGPPKLAFLFAGQGAQYVGMGRRLYESSSVARQVLERCDALLRDELETSLLAVMFSDEARLLQTRFTQPALFALELAVAECWRSWGIVPQAVGGHSLGEYVAATIAGVFSVEDGLRLAAARGRLMQSVTEPGEMLAIFASEALVRPFLRGREADLSVAAINGPASVVVAGRRTAVAALEEAVRAKGLEARRLHVSHAFHSPLMDAVLPAFRDVVTRITCRAPSLELVSNVSGRLFGPGEIPDADYWARHIRQPVAFAAGVQALSDRGYGHFVEIGPGATLAGLGRSCLPAARWMTSLDKARDDREQMLETLAALYVTGAEPNWGEVMGGSARRVAVPVYPFAREKHWVRTRSRAQSATAADADQRDGALPGRRLRSPLPAAQFEAVLQAPVTSWLAEHAIQGVPVFPATGHVDLVLAAAQKAFGDLPCELLAMSIDEPLVLSSDYATRVMTVLEPLNDGVAAARIMSQRVDANEAGGWLRHSTVTVKPVAGPLVVAAGAGLPEVRARCTHSMDPERFYDDMRARGFDYRGAFRGLRALWQGSGEALGRVELPENVHSVAEPKPGGGIHPAALDACLHVLGAALSAEDRNAIYLPTGIERIAILPGNHGPLWSHATVLSSVGGVVTGTLCLFDLHARPVGIIEALRLRKLVSSPAPSALDDSWFHMVDWVPAPIDSITAAAAYTPERWVVFAEKHGPAETLARTRADAGNDVVVVREGVATDGAADVAIDPANPEACASLLSGRLRAPGTCVVFAWHLLEQDRASDEPTTEGVRDTCRAFMHVVQAFAAAPAAAAPRLVLLTRGGARLSPDEMPSLGAAARAGFLRAVSREHPALHCLWIDIDPTAAGGETEQVLREIAAGIPGEEVAYRRGTRYVRRLAPAAGPAVVSVPAPADSALQVQVVQRGVLDSLTVAPVPRRAPGPGEVELRVHAAALNFRDVLNALGMYPGDPGQVGCECGGVVVRVGSGVEHLGIGDEVIGLLQGSLATFATGPAVMLRPKPKRLSFDESVSIPNAFLTVRYALHEIGGISNGDRVLIHAATGGVGLAAVQLARAAGAEIFATAGSPRKREYLKSIGVNHVMDSRGLTFDQEILDATGGRGVDLVLNSLSGPAIRHTLAAVSSGGRFIEIGKAGIWTPEEVARVRPDVQYTVFDLGEAIADDPRRADNAYQDLLQQFEDGRLVPLPTVAFPLADPVRAFRYMAGARHIGKIVLQAEPHHDDANVTGGFTCASNATYLITGGFGGLGLAVAEWLAAQGGKRLVLLGRRAPAGAARDRLTALRASGIEVTAALGDVSSAPFVRKVVDQIAASGAPLKGVVHAAGVIRDAAVDTMSWSQFEEVWAPKVEGAWHLHRLTMTLPLDFFVLFSSVSGSLGSSGQANYAAANSALDALAQQRHAEGLKALSINWGPWSEVGMAAGLGDRERERWMAQGVSMIAPAEGTAALGRVLTERRPQVTVLPIDWERFFRTVANASDIPLFEMVAARVSTGKADCPRLTLGELAAAPAGGRRARLGRFLLEQLAWVLQSKTTAIDDEQPITSLGFDSLMAVELRARLETDLHVQVSVAELLGGLSVRELSSIIAAQLDRAMSGGVDLSGGSSAAWGRSTSAVAIEEGEL